jgi:Xaa-Pro aminopeptidase
MTQYGAGRESCASMDIFRERIKRVQSRMAADGVMVLPAASARIRNRDTHFPYRAHSDMIYLTGVNEEELSLVLTNDSVHIFAQERNPERERWVGRVNGHEFYLDRLGRAGDLKAFAYPNADFEKHAAELFKGRKTLYYDFGENPELDSRLFKTLNELTLYSRRGVIAPQTVVRASTILHECRLFKDFHDLENMRRAAAISAAAHNRAQDLIEAAGNKGLSEAEVKALIEHEFMKTGADRLAYPSIVAAGANATVLHYEGTAGHAQAGDFILIDAGCEVQGYASDITRTTTVGGRGAGGQLKRDLYDLVLAAQKASIEKTCTGKSVDEVHQAAIDILATGLLSMGFFDQVPLRSKDGKNDPQQMTRLTSLEEVKEFEYYNLFYMHRTSHYLGLDVHDVGDYYSAGKSRALEPGMVITVEPGLYFPEEYEFVRKEASGVGIRIEDDVLVTAAGNEVLTSACRS